MIVFFFFVSYLKPLTVSNHHSPLSQQISAPAYRNLVSLCRICLDWCLGDVSSDTALPPAQTASAPHAAPTQINSALMTRAPGTGHDVGPSQIIDVLANSVYCRFDASQDHAAFTRHGYTWELLDAAGPGAEQAANAVTDGDSGHNGTFFLRIGLKGHPLWQSPQYWKNCLVENVAQEVARNGGWSLNECVYGVLPNMMNTMLGYDVPKEQVSEFILSWATAYGLSPEFLERVNEMFSVLANDEQS